MLGGGAFHEASTGKGIATQMIAMALDESAKFFYEKIGYLRIGAFLPPEQEADEIMYIKEWKP